MNLEFDFFSSFGVMGDFWNVLLDIDCLMFGFFKVIIDCDFLRSIFFFVNKLLGL